MVQIIKVGKKHPMSYYMFAKEHFNKDGAIQFQARGNAISTAARTIAIMKQMDNLKFTCKCTMKLVQLGDKDQKRWVPDMTFDIKKTGK